MTGTLTTLGMFLSTLITIPYAIENMGDSLQNYWIIVTLFGSIFSVLRIILLIFFRYDPPIYHIRKNQIEKAKANLKK